MGCEDRGLPQEGDCADEFLLGVGHGDIVVEDDVDVGALGAVDAVLLAVPTLVEVGGVPDEVAAAGVDGDVIVDDAVAADVEDVVGFLARGEGVGGVDGGAAEGDDVDGGVGADAVVGHELEDDGVVVDVGEMRDAGVVTLLDVVDEPEVVVLVGGAVDGVAMELVDGKEFGSGLDGSMRFEEGGEIEVDGGGTGGHVEIVGEEGVGFVGGGAHDDGVGMFLPEEKWVVREGGPEMMVDIGGGGDGVLSKIAVVVFVDGDERKLEDSEIEEEEAVAMEGGEERVLVVSGGVEVATVEGEGGSLADGVGGREGEGGVEGEVEGEDGVATMDGGCGEAGADGVGAIEEAVDPAEGVAGADDIGVEERLMEREVEMGDGVATVDGGEGEAGRGGGGGVGLAIDPEIVVAGGDGVDHLIGRPGGEGDKEDGVDAVVAHVGDVLSARFGEMEAEEVEGKGVLAEGGVDVDGGAAIDVEVEMDGAVAEVLVGDDDEAVVGVGEEGVAQIVIGQHGLVDGVEDGGRGSVADG